MKSPIANIQFNKTSVPKIARNAKANRWSTQDPQSPKGSYAHLHTNHRHDWITREASLASILEVVNMYHCTPAIVVGTLTKVSVTRGLPA